MGVIAGRLHTEDLAFVIPILLDVYVKLEDSPLRPWVADWILFVLSNMRTPVAENQVPSLQEFQQLIGDSAQKKESVYLDGLDLIDFGNSLSPAAIEFFDWLGKQEIEAIVERVENNRLSNLLAAALKSNPEKLALLRALSLWITEKTEVRIPATFLDIDRYENKLLKQAALTIRLVQGEWQDGAVSDLARWSADFINSGQISNKLLESTSLPPQVSRDLFTRLLVELRTRLPAFQWKQEARIVQRLNDSIRRRTSRFGDREVWIELGLPQGLISVLPQQ